MVKCGLVKNTAQGVCREFQSNSFTPNCPDYRRHCLGPCVCVLGYLRVE